MAADIPEADKSLIFKRWQAQNFNGFHQVDGALVADHQRDDHAGILSSRQRTQDTRAQNGTAVFNHIIEAEDEIVQPLIIGRRTYVAGRAQALLQQPDFVIEAVFMYRLRSYGHRRSPMTRCVNSNLGVSTKIASTMDNIEDYVHRS